MAPRYTPYAQAHPSFLDGLGAFLGGPGGMALLGLAPSLLGGLFSRRDPMHQARAEISRIMDPFNIEREGEQLYKNTLQSPGYNQARNDIVGGAQTAQMALARHLGTTGLGSSGVGAGASAAVAAAPGFQMGRLASQAWDTAMANANQRASAHASLLAGMPTAPNYGANLFAGGLNAILPMLLRSKSGGNDDLAQLLARLLSQES